MTFRYRGYTQGCRWRSMTLDAREFLRRFLLHGLPKGLMRIRSFGLLASRHRAARLARCRELLAAAAAAATSAPPAEVPAPPTEPSTESATEPQRCRHCGHGELPPVKHLSRPLAWELVAKMYERVLFNSS